jgi:hypothetical protein
VGRQQQGEEKIAALFERKQNYELENQNISITCFMCGMLCN